jgi:SbcC/RAD50-like, Walker B motif
MRFRPTRAGVINVWDYVDEEFAFADGRLALRGHNGSGKTKALEVLFPFVLDGVADSRRLDPFSGENRTMKSNLLFRGQDSEYGYVWMEFARPRLAAPVPAPSQAGPETVPAPSQAGPETVPAIPAGLQAAPAAPQANSDNSKNETVTLVIGMRANRSRDGVKMSFYVTGKRVGVDFGLLSADSRPLTEKQLRAVLEPDSYRRTATEYRDLIDARLFGLGRERYAQLLDLLLALRRPLLAKDLDPGKVSDTLTAGLSPVDDDLVQQAARDFENLAAVQALFDDLTRAHAAVGEFYGHYASYLRSHARYQLDRVQARIDSAAAHAQSIATAAATRGRALAAERRAETLREAKRDEGEQLQGRLDGLRNSEEYKAQGRIKEKRDNVIARAKEVAAQRMRLRRDEDRIRQAQAAASKLQRRVADAKAAEARHAAELADAGIRSGIADDGFGPVDSGDELLTTARARVAARGDDVRAIRQLLDQVRKARDRRGYAEADLGAKAADEQEQAAASDRAAQRLATARERAGSELAAWMARWAPPLPPPAGLVGPGGATASPKRAWVDILIPQAAQAIAPHAAPAPAAGDLPGHVVSRADAAALGEALQAIGEPGATGLPEVYAQLTGERQASVITARANLETELRLHRTRLQELRAERDAIAAERDDAPPPSDARPASREGRPGAPLWQLVRFTQDLSADRGAAIEGGLYGAGLLTAWIHPDAALTRDALAQSEADGYLIPAEPARGRSLADILVPEEQEAVPAPVIISVLRSIALVDDLAGAAGTGPVAVSGKAQFSYGSHVGARPKATPEFIGATNRARRRRARLAACDDLIATARAREQELATLLAAAMSLHDDFARAREELPDTRPIAQAAEASSRHAALLTRARDDVRAASKALDGAIAELDAKTRLLRQAAAERRMPVDREQVDAIARAAADFEDAAKALAAERASLARAAEDLTDATEAIARQRSEYAEAEAAFEEAERLQAAIEEELRALEEALASDVQRVLEQIKEAERAMAAAQRAHGQLDQRVRAEHDKATDAAASLRSARQSLCEALAVVHEQAAGFGEFARPDLRTLIGVTGMVLPHWPDPAQWPDPDRASEELGGTLERDAQAAQAAGQDGDEPGTPAGGLSLDAGVAAVRAVLPAGVPEILDAYAAATKGGRQVTEGTLKNAADRMSTGLKDFEQALEACEGDYRVDWEPGVVVVVSVIDDEGRKPLAAFADRIGERAQDQGVLLEDRERKVLEDELLAGLAHQIHSRVLAARDLTRDMDADTRSKPMSSGITIGIRWAQSDKITDRQRQASALLERDSPGPERLAELRGLLREMIREYRGAHPRATYREALASVLDYRSWHSFELLQKSAGEAEVRLTRARHSVMSGGEKSASIHLPLFAAANALYSSASPHCPRMIALDEAFVGIDERYKPDLFGLAVKFDLDLFMTGHDLWVTCDTVPMIAHYDMYHDKTTRTVSSLLVLWDGTALVDASASFADNEALATELLGFRPTRHSPLGTVATLYTQDPGPDPSDDEDDED